MSATCSSCRAPIRWLMTKAGAAMPVDPDAVKILVATGLTTIDRQGQTVPEFELRRGFRSHFDSCPFADEHRRKR